MKSIGFDCKRLRSIPRALLLWILLPILLLTLTRTTSATLATGGNITNDVGGYRIHVFTNSATASNFVVTFSGNIDVLVVGGGGGGGQRVGGGGGGGGVVYATNYAVPAGTTTVIVGNGGAGATSNVTLGTNGQNSAFDLSGGAGRTITALGGGGGSSYNRNPGTGASGGSGGGGSYISITPSSGGSASQSNSGISGATGYGCTGGVSATGSQFGGGGGGGAGGAGSNATTTVAGKGGPGIQFSQFAGLVPGSPAGYFAGGGGGGAAGSTSGSGGLGGGGNGKAGLNLTGITGDNGTNNTGGGGGGSWDDSAIKTNAGGTGGSGIVIVRYLSSTDLAIISQSPTLLGPGNATVNGLLTGDGGGTNTAVAFCCGYSDAGTNSGTSAWTTVVAVGTNCSKGQNLSATLAGLLSGSSYVYRCYASNTTGSAWSDTQRFTTIYLPAVRNLGPVNSTSGSTFQSQVTDTGGEAPYCWFLYWLASGGPTTTVAVGQQSGVFTNFAGDLALQQVYQYEVMASNSAGIAWSTISNAMNTANIWYVKTNGNDGAAGTNWTLAFKTISNVAARATAGDLILVTNGVYAVSNVVISSTTTPITMRSVDANPENTVLAGPGAAAGNIMRVLVLTNVNVSGFTIFKGESRVDGSEGGGVYMVNSVLSNCMVKSCCGSRSSSVYASSGLVTRCTFTNNYDQSNQSGVGALKLTSGAIVEYCTFIGNKPGSSTSPSSALWMLGNCTARYCIFTNNLQNSAITAGITVTITAGDLLQNCLIANNQGRGISMSGGTVQNCTVSGNAIYGNTGNGISMSGGAVVNSIVYFNDSDFYTTIASDISMTGGAISNSCMGPGTFVSGNGNISAEPRFTNPAARDYTLMPGSPCIDTGSNILSMATDLAGNLRRIDGNGDGLAIQDMGCYEAPTVNSGSLRCGVVASAHEGIDALGVTFTPYAEGADTNINFAGWIFGDGTTSNRADLSAVGHTYSAPGSYTVSLLISNVSLQSATAVITNDVRVSPLATFVSTNGSVTWPYDTWAKAAAGIPGAMSALMATGSVPLTITISNGTYTLGAQLVITKPIMIQSWNNNPANVLVSGGGAVSIFNAVNPLVTLSGLTITNAVATGQGVNGTAVSMANGGTITNCIFAKNTCNRGSTVYLNSTGLITRCLFLNSTEIGNSGGVGGVYVSNGGKIDNCTFTGNKSSGAAGSFSAIQMGGGAIVRNCMITNNDASSLVANSAVGMKTGDLIRNCLIANNGTRGIYIGATTATVQNCTIAFNTVNGDGGSGIYMVGSTGIVQNSIVWNNGAGGAQIVVSGATNITYSDVSPAMPTGAGNKSADPVFSSAGDYHLNGASSCVDAGSNNPSWMSGAVDLDGSNRIVNSIVDMGCYEKQAGANPFSCSFNSPVVQGITNVPAVFTATIAGANTNVVYYWWNFGDSTTDSGTNKPVESKTYTTPGYYTVSLAVSNTTGEYAVRTNTGYIYVAPKIAYVSTNGSSSTVPYDTWQKAASNLQSAINIALVFGGDSTLVLVTNGTYVCTNQIEVNKDITVQSVNGPAVTTVTRTNGQMTFWWVHSSGANVSGFTMTNGYCQTAVPGMLLAGGTVSNCVFNGNSGDRSSTLSMSAGTLSNCVIMNGTDLGSYQGCGGVTMTGGKIYNTVIMGNRGGSDSTAIGGLSISGGEVWNCIIASNVYGNGASGWNGGVNMTGGTLRNCLVAANTGNGITQSGGSCENVTVVRNSKVGITNSAGAVTNTIIWFNQSNDVAGVAANFHFCNASNLVNDPSGTGNLNGNPCFFSPGSGYGTNATLGNYRLLNYSPCVNHAVILPWMINATDLAGGRRVTGNTSDIGAYESIAAGTIIMLN